MPGSNRILLPTPSKIGSLNFLQNIKAKRQFQNELSKGKEVNIATPLIRLNIRMVLIILI